MDNRLWCELKRDKEKAEFLRSGRAVETGIIAQAIVDDVANAFDDKSGKIFTKKDILDFAAWWMGHDSDKYFETMDEVNIYQGVDFWFEKVYNSNKINSVYK